MIFSEEQQRRLGELGAASEDLQAGFADSAERNRAFQRLESRLVMEQQDVYKRQAQSAIETGENLSISNPDK